MTPEKEVVWIGSSFCCLTSTEARRPIRDADEWERGTEEWNLETGANLEDQGCRGPPPERQDVKAVSGITQRPQHYAIAVPTAMQNRVTKTMSVSPPLGNNWSKRSPTLSLQPSTTSLLLISSGLASSWESSSPPSPPSSWSRLDCSAVLFPWNFKKSGMIKWPSRNHIISQSFCKKGREKKKLYRLVFVG